MRPVYYKATGGGFAADVDVVTGSGNDVVSVLGTAANAPLAVLTGAGDDAVFVYPDSASGSTLASAVGVDAGPGNNLLDVNTAARSAPQALTITSAAIISGSDGWGVYYKASGGTFASDVDVVTGAGNDVVSVLGAAANAPLAIFAGAGDDAVIVYPSVGNLSTLASAVSIDAGPGNNYLGVNTTADTTPETIAVSSFAVGSTSEGWRVFYQASGGDLRFGVVMTTGSGAAVTSVFSTAAGTPMFAFVSGDEVFMI
jgi:hypothetical protein